MDTSPRITVGHAKQTGNCLFGADGVVARWLCDEIGEERGASVPCETAIGAIQGGFVRGALGFTNWRKSDFDIQIHAAFRPGCPSRDAVCQAMRFAFEQLECKRVTAVAVGNNTRALRFIEYYGFVREGTLKKAHRGEQDLVLYRLTPKLWKRRGTDKGRQFDVRPVSYLVTNDGVQVISHG